MKKQKDISGTAAIVLLGSALALLAVSPVRWLVNTWLSPDYDSSGLWVFLTATALFFWSVSSPLEQGRGSGRYAWAILGFTALIRLLGGLLAINTVGALALALDVLALGFLAGLARRQRAVSPWWLAALFVLSLPVERVMQRTIGYGLQLLSAEGAGALLSLFWEIQVEGMRILLAGRDVLVDLPCSGARGLMLMLIFISALMAVLRPGFGRGLLLGVLALAASLLGNIVRISLLAVGLAFPELIWGLNVMAQPWHDLIGLFSLALAVLPVVWLLRRRKNQTQSQYIYPAITNVRPTRRSPLAWPGALAFLLLALLIVNLPAKPVDVDRSGGNKPLAAPQWLNGHFFEAAPLSGQEQAYFTRYGGAAVKGTYGPNGLLLVRTSSPLRHLHAPDECLRGLGFTVEYMGLDHTVKPTAVYKAEGPDGRVWRVGVTFRSSSGRLATSVTEATWHWLRERGTWMAIQRLSPWDGDKISLSNWDQAVWAALDF
jgi:exosortase/archaeosortase family protein